MTSPEDPYGDRSGSQEAHDRDTSFMSGGWRQENQDPTAGYRPGEADLASWSTTQPVPTPNYGSPGPYAPTPPPPYEQWGQPQAGGYPTPNDMKPPTDGLAVGALVTGLVSIALGCFYGIGLLASPVAIGLGIAARRRIARSQGTVGGRGLATAAIALGALGTLLLIAGIVLVVFLIASTDWDATSTNALMG